MQRKPRVTSIWEWSNGGDHSEPWSPKTSTVCVMFTIVGNPAWGERDNVSCVGTREGRSGDCGRRARSWRCSLSRQGGNDNDNPIRKINNKVQVYQVRSLDRPLFIVFAQNSEGIIVTSQTREQGMRECAVKFIAVLRVRDQEESTLS